MKDDLAALIVPTGIGASIGGYAGDASLVAREFAKHFKLIVNPNTVNAGVFSGITDNMLYVEGWALNSFFKGDLALKPSENNKIGVVFDKAIPKEALNLNLNTINAVKTVYGVDVTGYEITKEPVGVEFSISKSGNSTGTVKNPDALLEAGKNLLKQGVQALAVCCLFDNPTDDENYSSGQGVDPIGGVEAVISHLCSRELRVPVAHAPVFKDLSAAPYLVNPRAAAEYISPAFLPCVLLGLQNAPLLVEPFAAKSYSVNDLKALVFPHNCLGSIPVLKAIEHKIPVCAVKENTTLLNVTKNALKIDHGIIEFDTYKTCLNYLLQSDIKLGDL